MTKNIVGIILLIAVLVLTYHNVTLSERYDMLEKRVEMQNKKSMRDSAISTSNGMILEKYVSANYNEKEGKIDICIELVPAEQREKAKMVIICNDQELNMERKGNAYYCIVSLLPNVLCKITKITQILDYDTESVDLLWTIRPCELVFPECESTYSGRGGKSEDGTTYSFSGTIEWLVFDPNILQDQVLSAYLIEQVDGEEIGRDSIHMRYNSGSYTGKKNIKISVNEKEEIKYILVLEFENGIILKHNSLKIDGTDLSHFYFNQGTEVSSSDFGWELTM